MASIISNYATSRFSKDDSALLLIDHQSGTMQLNIDPSPMESRMAAIALAKVGKIFNLPTILTSNYETGPNGSIIQELLDLHPNAPVIRRPGQISAWDNEEFVAAVKATGRKNLIMAGVTCQVCLAFPAMQAAAEGINVYGAIDASGSPDAAAREMTIARLVAHGVTPVNWVMVASELQRDWRLPTGPALTKLFHEHNPNYSMLIDTFQAHTKQAAAK
jgi:nicotinamidase-related amidase